MRETGEGAMDGIWFKRCPLCGSYMKKSDPREPDACKTCGWEEKMPGPPAD